MTDSASSTGKKLTAFYDELGIKTRNADGQLIDFYKVLDQMGDKWDTLTDDQKKYYANIQAGANQSQNLIAVLDNWKKASEAMETAMEKNSSGSAMKENEKYLDSVEGKLEKLRSAWQKLSNDFMSSELLKGILDIATKAVEAIDMVVEHVGSIPTAIGLVLGGGHLAGIFLKAMEPPASGGRSPLDKWVLYIGNAIFGKDAMGVLHDGSKKAGKKVMEGVGEGLKNEAKNTKVASEAMGKVTKEVAKETGEVTVATGGLFADLGAKFTAFKTAITPMLPMLAGIAVTAAAVGGALAWGDYTSLDKTMGRLEEYNSELDKTKDRIAELESKKENSGLTAQEERELELLKLQTKEIEYQIKLEKQRAKDAADKMLTEGSGKFGGEKLGIESSAKYQTASDKYIDAEKNLDKYLKKLSAAQKEKEEFEQGKRTTYDKSALKEAEMGVNKYTKALNEADAERAKFAQDALEDWHTIMEAGDTYQSIKDKYGEDSIQLANYQATRKAIATITLDNEKLKESYGDVATSVEGAFDIFKDGITVDDIDLSEVENSAQAIQEILDNVDQNQTVEIDCKDEAGDVIGKIDAQVKDLTDEQWQAVIEAQKTGDWSEVEKFANNPELKGKVVIDADTSKAKTKKDEITKPTTTKSTFLAVGLDKIKKDKATASKNTKTNMSFVASGLSGIASKVSSIISKAQSGKGFATGKTKGQKGGLAWIGDEGSANNPKPEMVVTKDGAYLAGTTGWELHNISDSDIVYSYEETKRLLGGRLATSGNKMMPRYAKGKSTKQKKQEEFDTKLETLEYNRDVQHWTDAKYEAEYKKLYDSYSKYLTTDQKRSYGRSDADFKHDTVTNTIEGLIDAVAENGKAQGAIDAIKKAQEAKKISEDEAKELRAKAYEEQIEYYARETKAGRKSYEELYKVAETYWKEVGKDTKEYYDSLDKLRDASEEKLKAQQERQEDELSYGEQYVKLQIAQLEKQKEINDKQKEQMDDAQSLVDLQNELSKARATMVRVFKEGVGWVYESDMNAIKDAQKALDEYYEEHSEDSIDAEIERWQAIADLFGDIKDQSELYALAQKLGVNSLADLVNGDVRDVQTMSDWIKSHDVWLNAYDDMIAQLDNMSAEQYAGIANTGVTKESMDALFDKYNFTDVLNTTNFQDALSSGISSALSPLLYNIRDNNKGTVDSNNDKSTIINIGDITLPNVTNSEEFVTGLKTLAIQYAYK